MPIFSSSSIIKLKRLRSAFSYTDRRSRQYAGRVSKFGILKPRLVYKACLSLTCGLNMKKKFLQFLLLISGLCSPLQSEEKRVNTLKNVDLFIENLTNKKGHNYGERYFAINHNDFPVKLSIKLKSGKNVVNKLVPFTIVVKPHEKVKLGKVVQSDSSIESAWSYEWEIEPDYK